MGSSESRELIFEVRKADEGGLLARARGESIFVEAEDWAALLREVRDAVQCHFDEGEGPGLVRLHFGRDEVAPV
jgi:hypothetical protein